MPPPGVNKRKRPERTYSDDQQNTRPSPHRPGNLTLAHQGHHSPGNDRDYLYTRGGRNSRRPSRGGRGGNAASSPVSSPLDNPPASTPNRQVPRTNGTMNIPPATDPPVIELTAAPTALEVFNYTYVTDALIAAWDTSGKGDVLREASNALQETEGTQVIAIMHELVQSVIRGRIDPTRAGELVKELFVTEGGDKSASSLTPTEGQAALLDALSIISEASPSFPGDRLAAFLLTTDIPHELLRQELDATLLEKLDLIRNTFSRVLIRKQTNILYRQANFNLMREESEGFAKLITELFTTSNNEPPSAEVVQDTVEKVKAMIGAFDLDVGRTLDVVLDVFGAVLVKQFRFFVKFLRASPWWPRQTAMTRKAAPVGGIPLWALPGSSGWHLTAEQQGFIALETEIRDTVFWPIAREQGLKAFYLLGRSQVAQEQIDRASEAAGDDVWAQWVRQTGTIPPLGNRDAAQLLGFKLRFYSSSSARDENDVLPDNLIYLSALLIKIGFISLKDLYPHIWRTDEGMEELKQQKTKEKVERERSARPGAGVKNALLMAGALADDTLPIPSRLKDSVTRASTPSREPDAEKIAVKDSSEPSDQKVLLLKSLFAIGALPEALFILGKFPWLMDLYPDLPEHVHRILHHCLSKIYNEIRPLQSRPSLRDQAPTYETDIPGLQKGQVKIVEPTVKKTLRWPLLDKNDSADGTDYRFYWDEWNDNIPICQSVDDVFTLTETLLPLVGVKIGQDPGLLLKFARIGKHSLQADRSEPNRTRWLDLSKRVLLPALSLTRSNAGVVNEVFELISHFPVSVRYLLYVEWSSGRTSRNPDIKAAFDQAKAETKDILKRISNTNVRPMARALAKIAFANPHIVITTALPQIEVYDSIAEVFVEGARYFTDLGYDVLTWAVVSSMARSGRIRIQEGGMFTSKWLIALSQFAGKIYKRYGMMRPGPVLQYVVEQLEQGNTADLKMLEQIVASMGGIATDTSYNDAQLQAMGGGPLLQSQTILQVLDRRHDSKKTSERLMKSLHDTGLGAKFLIALAQQRQACVFDQRDVPLKVMGNTYDEVQRVMVQYLELLRYNLSTDEFRTSIPNVVSLLIDYEIRPEISFWISRSIIAKQMQDFDKETKSHLAEEIGDTKGVSGDVEMAEHMNGGSSEEDGEALEADNADDSPAETGTPGILLDLDSTSKPPGPDALTEDCWHPVMKDVMIAIQPYLPEEVVEVVGIGFYTTFWQLSLYDITIPGKSYEDEMSRQKKKIAAISSDRSDVSASGTKKKELAKKELSELMDKLLAENKDHLKAFSDSKARLQREKDQWFIGKARMDKQLNTCLMEQCFLPRLLSSPLDAYFCFKFVKFLHGAGTPNFRTLGFYDLLFKPARLASLIFICTSKESDNLGRFLNEILKDLTRWHSSKGTYEREGWGIKKSLPGFAMKVEAGKVVSLLDFDSFRRVLYKWHSNLSHALVKCLTSPEYMHVRNAISVLRAISTGFPAINSHGVGLQKAVDKLGESDKEDLKVSSQALLGALHRREKLWVSPGTFRDGHDSTEQSEQVANPPKQLTQKPATPAAKPTLKAEEDGEVKDTVMADAPAKVQDTQPPVAKDIAPAKPNRGEAALKPEASVDSPRPISRAAAHESSTPSRQPPESTTGSKRESRPVRADSVKPPNLPRRPSPVGRGPPPAHLPSRPENSDLRNGHRDSPRISGRQIGDVSRPTPEPRAPHPRELRPSYRGPEGSPYDDYERHSRRYERTEGPPSTGREERGYLREREHERGPPYDRSRPSERDRPLARPAPADREREPREPTPRTRPGAAPESLNSEGTSQKSGSQRREPAPTSTVAPAINPDRAALIEGSSEPRSTAASRIQAQDRPSRSSRPSSPRREEERRQYPRREAEDRGSLDRRPDLLTARQPGQPPGFTNDSSPYNAGPRPSPRDHATRESKPPRQTPFDMQHGRLEQEPTTRPSSSSNADRPTPSDAPSGPRTRPPPPAAGAPTGRGPPVDTVAPSPAQGERPTPTGPSGRRHGRNSSYNESPARPGTPDSVGVHPSRLNQIDSAAAAAAAEGPRSNQAGGLPPPTQPPAGPRGQPPVGAPSGPLPTSRGPPAGPHIGDGGGGRGGRNNRHPLTAVNNTLAQAGQGASIRGRGSGMRQNSAGFGSHMQPPPPPPPPGGPPPSNGYPPQQDLFASSNPNDMPVGTRPATARHNSNRDRRSDYGEERPADRRPTRHPGRPEDPRGDREPHGRGDGREGKEERHGHPDAPRHSRERPNRREDHGPGPDGDERRGGGGYPRAGPPRDEQPSRKHPRGDEGAPYGGGPGADRGGNGPVARGGGRAASDSKRPRRGP